MSYMTLFPLDVKLVSSPLSLDQGRQKAKGSKISFVPSSYEYLSDAFRRYFPKSKVAGKDIRYRFDSRQARRQLLEEYQNSSKVVVAKDLPTLSKVQSKKRQRDQVDDDDDEMVQEAFPFPCELVFNTLDNSYAVVALLDKDEKNGISRLDTRDNTYEDKMVQTALLQYSNLMSTTLGAATQSGIVLGHLMLDSASLSHPVNSIDHSLVKNRWIRFTNSYVTLKPPFLPEYNVFGPNSTNPIGRAIPSLTIELDERRLWRDPETNQTWNECPRSLLAPDEIYGRLHLQVQLTDEALRYGTMEEHDGFVDAYTVSRRSLTLASKLKSLIMATVQSTDGLLAIVPDDDEYWNRTPLRYYDKRDHDSTTTAITNLELDNRLETALEATRPSLDSPESEARDSIKTALLPFQKKALAWMLSKEQNVSGDEGALLPHWIKIKIATAVDLKENDVGSSKRQKLEKEVSFSNTLYMDSFTGTLSRRRLASRQSEPGGCLCDSMGLGKSLSTLALIETHQRTSSYVDQSRTAQMTAGMVADKKPFVSTSTLLVVPSSLVHQWYSEINKHLGRDVDEEGSDNYILRYRRDKTIPWTANDDRQHIRHQAKARLASKDQAMIVLATYEELSTELQVSKRSKKAISPLLDIHWWRIMLDEAQLVSTSNGSAAEMVNCLWRTNGWIVTSTPFNSSIRDMHGLLTFLDSDFASKKLFEELIAMPFIQGNVVGIQRAHSLLKRIMWRHCKEHVENELGLPPSSMQTLFVEKTGLEKTLYDREYKSMLSVVKGAIGLGRGLTKKQQDRLLSLRKLISHPQLASSLGYGGPGSQRTTFANLFADLIFRNQGDLYNAQMEFITLTIKVGAGIRFRKEERESEMWKGGSCNIKNFKLKMLKARQYAREGVARDLVFKQEVAAAAAQTIVDGTDAQEAQSSRMAEAEAKVDAEVNDASVPESIESAKSLKGQGEQDEEGKQGKQGKQGEQSEGKTGKVDEPTKVVVPITMRYDEALYWIDVLLGPKSEVLDTDILTDPERLINLFFEKQIQEANCVDLTDSRYHPIVLDAGDEEEEVGEDDTGNEATLLKNRFRGNSKRSIQKVWSYHPRRKLQSLCRDIVTVEEKITRLQGEGAYLENRIREELGEERARLVMKEGFDAVKVGGSNKERGEGDSNNTLCPLCYDQIDAPGILPCLHTACFACLDDCINKIGLGGQTPCPMCRKLFEKKDVIQVVPMLNETDHVNEFGVKISGLITHLRQQLHQDSKMKIVIFSAWSSYLDFLTEALNNLSPEPILSVAFGGNERKGSNKNTKKSGGKQSTALKEFQNNEEVRIMLVPMKMSEGAAGLTLNFASIAYLLEPSLNSALEDQALGRLNRIGQKADKTTYFRVLVENTIEPALVQIAERRLKELKDKDADTKHHDTLSVDELALCFGLNVEEEKAKRRVETQRRAHLQADLEQGQELPQEDLEEQDVEAMEET